MKTVHKSVLIWHSAPQMFALVADVARYPEFLPWCSSGQVIEETPQGMVASIGMSLGGLKKSFTTRNRHIPNEHIELALVDGPFSHLEGTWDFKPVGQGDLSACKIDFTLNYGFASSTLATLVGPVFDKIAASLVDAFVKRADQVYGT